MATDRELDRDLEFAFFAARTGSGPATWGQHAIWDVVRTLGSDAARYNVSGGGGVEPGLPAKRVLDALRELFLLHDSLRTTLHVDDAGQLEQRVHSSGRAVVVTRRCAPEQVPAEADALLARLAAAPFDFEHEWPARFGIVESGGLVRHLVLALSHTAVDAWGLRHLVEDLSELSQGELSAQQLAQRRSGRLQPLDEARFQASDRGRRQDAAARRHWRTKLSVGPQRMFTAAGAESGAAPSDGNAPRPFPNATFDSPALALALRKVTARHAVSSSSVLLAATAAMTARLSGSPDAAFQVVVNNRFLPGLDGAVSTVAQEGLFHLAGADGDFSELVRRSFGSSLSTYRNAYYHKASLERDVAQLRAERDGICDLTCFFNDTRGVVPGSRGTQDEEPSEDLSKAALEGARARTALSWPTEFEPRSNTTFALDVLDTPGATGLSMTADSTLIPRADMERLLYGIEDLVVGEAIALG